LKKLESLLAIPVSQGKLQIFYDEHLPGGAKVDKELLDRLRNARIIILLLGNDFFTASDYIRDKELPLALEQELKGQAKLVPVLLETLPGLEHTEIGQFNPIPNPKRGLLDYQGDEIHQQWTKVYTKIMEVVQELRNS